ncbi:hypothetical protein [Reyranella sp.]|uniref:hypothetical protein n=1 Tax=Reyranella sp. TaxID=1929291 RepID=UPI001226A6FD|nr:hypothetical protein [Reyranella sp.]TAJ89711.1 MAG: hypothetical protein EPO50_04930 [Reyranella sp.]
MSKTLAKKLKNIVDIWEAADAQIEEQRLIQKGALDAGKENDGIEPAVVRKILARRKKLAKDPAETTRLEDLMVDYQFLLGEGREGDARPWTQADDEVSRVMALTNTDKPPKIEAIKKALGCSQGKAHKLRTLAATRLAKKSSSSCDDGEHEHSEYTEGPEQGAAGSSRPPDDAPQAERPEPPAMPAPDGGVGTGTISGIGKDDAEPETGVGGDTCTDECSGRPTGAPVRSSCGERLAPLGAKGLADSLTLTTAPSRPHDTLHASGCAVHNEPAYPAGPCDCGTSGDTRGEAPNADGMDILPFLRRDSTRVVA